MTRACGGGVWNMLWVWGQTRGIFCHHTTKYVSNTVLNTYIVINMFVRLLGLSIFKRIKSYLFIIYEMRSLNHNICMNIELDYYKLNLFRYLCIQKIIYIYSIYNLLNAQVSEQIQFVSWKLILLINVNKTFKTILSRKPVGQNTRN